MRVGQFIFLRSPWPSASLKPGEYTKSLQPSKEKGWATVRCPECHGLVLIGRKHAVADDGTVTPNLCCPFDHCMFDEPVWLGAWSWDRAS